VLRPPRGLRSAVPLLIAAGLGGGTALAGAEVIGMLDDDSPSVINRVEPLQPSAPAAFADNRRLSVSSIYQRSGPGVVQITTTTLQRVDTDPFFNALGFPQQRRQKALGSGFVIDKAGHIVTNFHVVEDAETVEVSFSNRDSVRAQVVGTDPSTDLAVLKVDVDAGALTPLDLGDSDRVNVGDSVVAIGNPFGLERSVTAGIVSALHRPLTAPNAFTIDDVIQTDAAINSGNSGGPLIDARGLVVGVNSAIATGNTGIRGNVGIGFAVPINTVRDVASQLIERGKVEHAFLGIGVQPVEPEVSRLFDLPVKRGLLIVRVYDSSGADKAGLRAGTDEVVVSGESYLLGGDILVAIDGTEIATPEDLREVISARKPGDKLTIEAYRGSDKRSFEVTLGRRPARP
jgi:S1-C subfamily serine protease